MLRNVLFVRKFVEKAHESSFPLGNEIQVAQPVHGGPRGTKWGLHNLYFDWASSSRATDNVGYIAVNKNNCEFSQVLLRVHAISSHFENQYFIARFRNKKYTVHTR